MIRESWWKTFWVCLGWDSPLGSGRAGLLCGLMIVGTASVIIGILDIVEWLIT